MGWTVSIQEQTVEGVSIGAPVLVTIGTVELHTGSFLPDQTGQAGAVLGTDGTDPAWVRTIVSADGKADVTADDGAAWVGWNNGTAEWSSAYAGETYAEVAAGDGTSAYSRVRANQDGSVEIVASGAATLNGDDLVVDTDSRLTDARTPTAHAASHADGGSDEVTLAQSQVTGLVSALAAFEANDWVTAARIAANAVGSSELATDAVTNGKIIDGAVTSLKLASTAITRNLLTANQASLETDTTGWTVYSGCTIARSTVDFFSGAASLLVTHTGTGVGSAYTSSGTSGAPVVPGRIYTASARVKIATGTRVVRVRIVWFTAAGAEISRTSGDTFNATAWSEVRATGIAPATAAFAAVMTDTVDSGSIGDSWYIDAIGFWEGAGGSWVPGGERVDPSTLGYYWDESVGRRRFAWDTVNSRWQMVYGDTGWRSITLTGSWTGAVWVRRVGFTVTFRSENLIMPASGITILTVPSGFVADVYSSTPILGRNATSGAVNGVTVTDNLVWGGTLTATNRLDFCGTFPCTVAWPTSLPGVASGSIPYN